VVERADDLVAVEEDVRLPLAEQLEKVCAATRAVLRLARAERAELLAEVRVQSGGLWPYLRG